MLVTDDKHPGDLLQWAYRLYHPQGHYCRGRPVVAVRMGTLVPCQYFGLAHSGAVAPGYTADLIVLSDLEKFTVEQVYKKGKLVAQQGRMLHPAALTVDKARFARVFDSFNMDEITPEQLQLKQTGTRQRVICLTPHALLTTEKSFRSASTRAQRPAWMWRNRSSSWRCSSGITAPVMWDWAFWATTACNAAQCFQHCPRLPQPHRGGHQRCRHGAGGQHGAQK